MSEINEKIFKAYDVRGVYPDEIDEDVAYKTGRAFVAFLGKKNPSLVIGRDGRNSSPVLFESLKRGVLDSGGTVVDTGLSSTPLLNFSVAKLGYDGGVMVTASHNPPKFNGLKLIREKALQVYGKDIQKIKEIVIKEDFRKGRGREIKKDFLSKYVDHTLSFVNDFKGIRVVVDCGNGMGGVTAVPVLSRTKAEPFFLYEDIDGSFPNHLPDPHNPKSISAVYKKLMEKGADIGVLFDGDADRCILIDEKGDVVFIDHLLSLLASEELKMHPGEDIYYDLRFSMATSKAIKKAGGNPVMMRVGNPYYKEKIIKEGGLLGAELTGHVMFRENFGIDDGLFALLKTLNIMEEREEKLSDLLNPFKKYFQTEEINLRVEDKKKTLEKARELFGGGEELFIDGVYIKYNDWWFSLRESNTEDLVRLRIEAKTKNLLEEKRKELIDVIKKPF